MSINLDASNGTMPHYIQESWKRCHSKGLEPTTMDKKNMLADYELAEYYDQYEELLYYSSPILKDVYDSIHGTESILLVAAPEGYIIDAVGDPSFIRHADNVALRKGANWLEESKGTNAIGTAIVERKPVLVHGSQHFYQDNHFLTCAATPIFHPDGQLLGVLNLSSHMRNYHPFSLSLVKRVAHSIQQALLLAHTQKQTKDLYFIYDQHPNSLITVNKEGRITSLNFAAARAIGCSEQTAVGQPITSLISMLDFPALIAGQEQKFSLHNQLFTAHTVIGDNQNQSCVIVSLKKQKQKGGLTNRYHFADIISNDTQMNETISVAKRAAALDISLLVTGESGTGKELFAQSIHGASLRRDKPFIAINCSAIPDSLLESELFGYEKGAFTGAKNRGQAGKFEAADGGTLFLDEIGDMPLTAQATLLRVLQERCVTPIGGITPRPIDVRIIAATNKDLQKEIEVGQFRADLFFRLNGLTLKLPAIRNRTDLLLLAEHILSRLAFKKENTELTEDAKAFIEEYDWPGNFRQLHNVLQQAAFLADHNPITKTLLVSLCPDSTKSKKEEETKPTSLLEQEIQLIKQTLDRSNGNISNAAKQLNIGRNTLYRKMKTHNIVL